MKKSDQCRALECENCDWRNCECSCHRYDDDPDEER